MIEVTLEAEIKPWFKRRMWLFAVLVRIPWLRGKIHSHLQRNFDWYAENGIAFTVAKRK